MLDFKNEKHITAKEINRFVEEFYKKYLDGSKKLPEDNLLKISFSANLEAIDELFYAYLLLFKQSFPEIKIVLSIPANKPKQIAMQQITYLNAYYTSPFISIAGEYHLKLKNTNSKEFIPHILIRKNERDSTRISGFEASETDVFREAIGKINVNDIIKNIGTSVKDKEEALAFKIKTTLGQNPSVRQILSIYYRIDILAWLGVLKYSVTGETDNENSENIILTVLERNNFFKCSRIELFFFYLSIFQLNKSGLKQDYEGVLNNLFKKVRIIQFGLKELAKNIIEHAGDKGDGGFGVIAARIHSTKKIEALKSHGEHFDTWFQEHKGDQDVFGFLDINVIDNGTVGVTKNYISTIEAEKKIYEQKLQDQNINHDTKVVCKKLVEALDQDIDEIGNPKRGYRFFHFLNYKEINLLHQLDRISARIGLHTFSNLVCEKEKGIVIASSIDKSGKPEKTCFYERDHVLKAVDYDENIISFGTNYNFLIPLVKKNEIKSVVEKNDIIEQGVPTSLLKELLHYEKLDSDDRVDLDNDNIYVVELKNELQSISGGKYEKIIECADIARKNSKRFVTKKGDKINDGIVVVDAQMVSFTSSDWLRFLFNIQRVSHIDPVPMIVYNIERKCYDEIIGISRMLSEGNKVFWGKDRFVLFYIKHDYSYESGNVSGQSPGIGQKVSLWFSSVLTGESYNDFLALNRDISSYQYNLYNISDETTDSKFEDCIESSLFHEQNLLNFELLIHGVSGATLLDESTSSLLDLEISVSLTDKEFSRNEDIFFNRLKTYKISNSHFRLGSKIHISDFYYAKPFFQNSFFAQKYAFLLAKHIIGELKKPENSSIKELTLIGYGLYSELLVSFIKTLLENYRYTKGISINYNTVNDAEECKLNRPSAKLHDNVIIIIPIATTFSTSSKIEKMLISQYGGLNIISPHLNVLLVADSSFEEKENSLTSGILKRYGWEYIDKINRIITAKPFNSINDSSVKQKYFFYKTTEWNEIKNCKHCFPDGEIETKMNCKIKASMIEQTSENEHICLVCPNNCALLKEKPLFGTDKTSLTPELILDKPKARTIYTHSPMGIDLNYAVIGGETIEYGHFKRNENHYHYYPDDHDFWEKNKDNVRIWLDKLRGIPFFKDAKTERTVILSPGHFSNADFGAMVNEVIFENRATILHYDAAVENTQNFWLFYGKEIVNADKVYFVDDVITSGTTFITANSFLKRIKNEFGETISDEIGFNACLFLVNRSGYYEFKDIQRKLGVNKEKIYSYTNLHIPYIKSFNNRCPLCDELEKYKVLYRNSYLTKIKLRFLRQQYKLREISIYDGKKERASWDSSENINKYYNRSKRKAEAVHRIYNWFSYLYEDLPSDYFSISQNPSSNRIVCKWFEDLMNENLRPFEEAYLKKNEQTEQDCLLSDSYISILKVLTQAPFYSFKFVREKVFRIVVELLDKKVQSVFDDIQNGRYDILNKESFEELKFLIRRACILNSNYIISYKMLELLRVLYNKHEEVLKLFLETLPEGAITERTAIREAEDRLRDFSPFFVMQINELLHNNEARSIELKKRLERFERNNASLLFKQLVRMIREENGAIVRIFAEFFAGHVINEKKIEYRKINKQFIKNELEEWSQGGNFRFDLLKEFLKGEPLTDDALLTDDTLLTDNTFLEYLELKILLQIGKDPNYRDRETAKDQAKRIFELLRRIVGPDTGCFAIVKYKKNGDNPYFLLHNEWGQSPDGKRYSKSIRQNKFYLFDSFLCADFLEKGNNAVDRKGGISIVECCQIAENNWKDLFAEEEESTTIKMEPLNVCEAHREHGRLLLLRIDRDKFDNKKLEPISEGQAVIGFYSNKDGEELTDINVRRYLLMLREDISNYLKAYCETDEFRDWVEEKEQLAIISTADHDYNKILSSLKKYRDENDNHKFDFLHSLLTKREEIRRFFSNDRIEYIKIEDEEKIIDIKEEINILLSLFPLEPTEEVFDSCKEIKIEFPKYIFRSILYEYIKNAYYKSNSIGANIPNIFSLKVVQEHPDIILINIQNKAMDDYYLIKPYSEILGKRGYMFKEEKGLHKNSILLYNTVQKYPKITFTEPDSNGIYEFSVNITIKKYNCNGTENQ